MEFLDEFTGKNLQVQGKVVTKKNKIFLCNCVEGHSNLVEGHYYQTDTHRQKNHILCNYCGGDVVVATIVRSPKLTK